MSKTRYLAQFMAIVLLCGFGVASLGLGSSRSFTMDASTIEQTIRHLRTHLQVLTRDIGERSVDAPLKHARAAEYIEACFTKVGLAPQRDIYVYRRLEVANIVARLSSGRSSAPHYIIGAHYDSVSGTVGADDNASAVAVLLETARHMARMEALTVDVTFVAFALEEPPVFGTPYMGSRVFARKAKAQEMAIAGMICLEMVGYTCASPGCQAYPFPLNFMNYPETGEFVGIVGNFSSRSLTRALWQSFRANPDLPVIKLTVPLSGWLMPSVRLSDHAPFWDQGFKAVMVTDSAFYRNPYYHTAADTMDTLDLRFMAELVESLIAFFQSR